MSLVKMCKFLLLMHAPCHILQKLLQMEPKKVQKLVRSDKYLSNSMANQNKIYLVSNILMTPPMNSGKVGEE